MKSRLLTLIFSFAAFGTFAQGNNGLIAHWSFNGNTNDVSGHGLNGVGTNVTSAAGYNGIANTAYQFNGTSSQIDIANNSLLNIDSGSICFLLKVNGFYSGPCQLNTVFNRGPSSNGPINAPDNYNLTFGDASYDSSCTTYTLSHEVFTGEFHSTSAGAYSNSWYSNSDTITLNTWYCINCIYKNDSFYLYIDGTLRKIIYEPNNYAPGSDSLQIGYFAPGVNTGYPFWFNGVIDDIRLYNRPLSAAEVVEYCDTAKMLPTNQVSQLNNINADVFIYPNPAHNNINIQLPDNAGTSEIKLLNTLGQVIADMKPSSSSVNLDISILPAGLYIIKAEYKGQCVFKKIFKK